MRHYLITLALMAAGCGSNNPPPPTPYPGRLDPIVGQWTDYGTGTGAGFIQRLTNPFWMPLQTGGQSVNYVYTAPVSMSLSQRLTLNYTITGYAQFGVVDPKDISPASIRLFIWAANDNGGEFGRWWCTPLALAPGNNQVWECPLDPSAWADVYGNHNAAQFGAALTHPYAIGFTFGGQYFAGHGVWVTVGAASFKINSFTVQ